MSSAGTGYEMWGLFASILTFMVAWSHSTSIWSMCPQFVKFESLWWKLCARVPGSVVSFRQSKDILTKLGWHEDGEWRLRWGSLEGSNFVFLQWGMIQLNPAVESLPPWLQPRNQDFGCAQHVLDPVVVIIDIIVIRLERFPYRLALNILKLRWIFPERNASRSSNFQPLKHACARRLMNTFQRSMWMHLVHWKPRNHATQGHADVKTTVRRRPKSAVLFQSWLPKTEVLP